MGTVLLTPKPLKILFALGFASLAACSTSPPPVAVQTCDAIDGNVYPGNRPSYIHVALTNDTNETISNIVIFVTYTNSSYGFPNSSRQSFQPRQRLSSSYRLSENENIGMIGGKWEYSCWLESATFADGRVWSGAVRHHWPRI